LDGLAKTVEMNMKVWIQHSDFSEEEFDLDLASTLRMFEDIDWLDELAMEQKRAESGDENCPPGFGIAQQKERILHVCPNPSGALVHFHYPKKVMGLFNKQQSLTMENVPREQVKSFIKAFFAQEWEAMENYA